MTQSVSAGGLLVMPRLTSRSAVFILLLLALVLLFAIYLTWQEGLPDVPRICPRNTS